MAVEHFDSDSFQQALQGAGVVLVDFFATWCMPCKMVAPVIEKIAGQYAGRVTVGKVDIDEEPDLAASYRVQSVPSILIFKNGELAATLVGARPYEAFAAELDKLL